MSITRITVSPDEDAMEAPEDVTTRTGRGPSGNVDFDENADVASDTVMVDVSDCEFQDGETIPADDLV
jgi:hypothetical protein